MKGPATAGIAATSATCCQRPRITLSISNSPFASRWPSRRSFAWEVGGFRERNKILSGASGPFESQTWIRGMSAIFDPSLTVLDSANEIALTTVGDDQIASIYGVRFRSTPIFFITDDHDYFDNDDATLERVTFPPEPFHRSLRDSLQKLYFPEFIVEHDPDPAFPGLSTQQGCSPLESLRRNPIRRSLLGTPIRLRWLSQPGRPSPTLSGSRRELAGRSHTHQRHAAPRAFPISSSRLAGRKMA